MRLDLARADLRGVVRERRLFRTVLIFGALGPPIGSWALAVMIVLGGLLSFFRPPGPDSPVDLMVTGLFVLFVGPFFSYAFGLAPALGVGVLVALWDVFVLRGRMALAALLGVASGVPLGAASGNLPGSVAITLAATLACTHLSGRPSRAAPLTPPGALADAAP